MRNLAKKKKIHIGAKVGRILLIPAFGLMLVEAANGAEYSYSESNRSLYVDVAVADGELPFDFANYGKYLIENLATNFVKRGDGTLVGGSDLSAYLGNIIVESGTYTYTTNCALGRLAGENVCGSVYVKNGATLDARPLKSIMGSSGQPWGWFNKRILFEGDGVDGKGALICTGDRSIDRMVFSSNLVMTANAKMANLSNYSLYMSGGSYPMLLDMNGYDLTIAGDMQLAWGCWNIRNPGNITTYAQLTIQNNYTAIDGDATHVLAVKNQRSLLFNKSAGQPIRWTLDAREMSTLHVVDGGVAYNRTNCSYWSGPVLLGSNRVFVGLNKGYWFTLEGPISGTGGLYVHSLDGMPGQFNLMGTGSTFTGGVRVNQSAIAIWNDGALPYDGAALMVTNSTVLLPSVDDVYALPELSLHGESSVIGGYGSWKSVTKTGAESLAWDSCSGSKMIEVKEGTLELLASRKFIAGLIESERAEYSTYNETMAAWDVVATNIVVLGPDAYYDRNHHLWTDPVQNPVSNRFTIAYTGYIWNNSAETVKWSFAGIAHTHLNLRLDGQTVFHYKGLKEATSSMRGTVEVSPGPHKIDIRGYSTSLGNNLTRGDALKNSATDEVLYWPATDFAVGFDPQGRGSDNQSDYVKLIDPGDGSLLTWTLPEDVEHGVTIVPGTDRKVYLSPSFEKMIFAAGTGMDSQHKDFSVADLVGLPSIAGITGTLTIGSSWSMDAIDIIGGAKLTTEGRLEIGPNATVSVMDDTRAGRGLKDVSFVVAEAAGGIVWPESVRLSGATLEWRLSLSPDGTKVIARHLPIGTKVILR